jgi:DNA-binding HxlR family transcriptional regulator
LKKKEEMGKDLVLAFKAMADWSRKWLNPSPSKTAKKSAK